MNSPVVEPTGLRLPANWLVQLSDAVAESFGFVFKDPRWVHKVIVGSIMVIASMFLIGVVFLAGYTLRLARRVRSNEPFPLPEWDDWGEMFTDGLKAMAIYIGHVLPIAMVGAVLVLAMSGALSLAIGSDELPGGIKILIALALFAGALVYAVLIIVVSVAVLVSLVRFVETGQLADAIDIRGAYRKVRNNLFPYLVAFWTIGLANFAAQFGFLILCIGMFPAAFWCVAVTGHAIGSAASSDTASGVEPVEA